MSGASHFRRIAVFVAILLTSGPTPALAQADFFRGKTINLYIGFGPGGTYDYYSRMAARHMGKYIPGHPTIVAQNMPGAGSFQAANFLYAVAPKDGTALGMITQAAAVQEALGAPGVQYKTAEFNWIGRMSSVLELHFTWKTSKAKTIADARQHEIPLAGTGAGSPSEAYPKLLNALAGTKFKIISGYPGSTQAMMAMERGEVDGALTSWDTLNRTKKSWLDSREINLLVQYRLQRSPDVPDIPTAIELGSDTEAKQVLAFHVGSAELGRSIVAPPGVPAERVKILRDAFAAMLKDAELRAEIERTGLEFQPGSGAEVQKLIQDTAATPRSVVERSQDILRVR
jgi:tripartite-type tricarboxylate transporter receptor subunit TctC